MSYASEGPAPPCWRRTLGIPLFQEQGHGDRVPLLPGSRRPEGRPAASAASRPSSGPGVRVQKFRERFIVGCIDNGYDRTFAEAVFRQLEGFSGYGFPQSHAASFAFIVYTSCWLKRHHPDVFGCALLNSQPMGFYAPAQIVQDMQAHGIRILPVCVENSFWDCSLEPDREGRHDGAMAVRLGFRQVGGLREDEAHWIAAARANGYRSIDALLATGGPVAPQPDPARACRRLSQPRHQPARSPLAGQGPAEGRKPAAVRARG